jgi:hypothetical protein
VPALQGVVHADQTFELRVHTVVHGETLCPLVVHGAVEYDGKALTFDGEYQAQLGDVQGTWQVALKGQSLVDARAQAPAAAATATATATAASPKAESAEEKAITVRLVSGVPPPSHCYPFLSDPRRWLHSAV